MKNNIYLVKVTDDEGFEKIYGVFTDSNQAEEFSRKLRRDIEEDDDYDEDYYEVNIEMWEANSHVNI